VFGEFMVNSPSMRRGCQWVMALSRLAKNALVKGFGALTITEAVEEIFIVRLRKYCGASISLCLQRMKPNTGNRQN
jgi:hypothetical protein